VEPARSGDRRRNIRPNLVEVAAIATSVVALRLAAAGILLGPEGVRMRGFLRTRSAPWSQVAQFSTRQQWAAHTPRAIVIELVDGRSYSSAAVYTGAGIPEQVLLGRLRDAQRLAISSG
jgi:cytochrome c-type biogenesis protein CcmH/NrfG